MALTPAGAGLLPEIETRAGREEPSMTYRIDFDAGRVTGSVDGLDAMRQAVYMILSTERFRHVIYSWDYGTELSRLLGRSSGGMESEAKRVISEALLADDRVTAVRDFTFTRSSRRTLAVSFTAETALGDIAVEREVET